MDYIPNSICSAKITLCKDNSRPGSLQGHLVNLLEVPPRPLQVPEREHGVQLDTRVHIYEDYIEWEKYNIAGVVPEP